MNLNKVTKDELETVLAYAIEDLNPELSKDELIEAYEDLEKIDEAKDAIKQALEDL